jgi:hypothetical protein
MLETETLNTLYKTVKQAILEVDNEPSSLDQQELLAVLEDTQAVLEEIYEL